MTRSRAEPRRGPGLTSGGNFDLRLNFISYYVQGFLFFWMVGLPGMRFGWFILEKLMLLGWDIF